MPPPSTPKPQPARPCGVAVRAGPSWRSGAGRLRRQEARAVDRQSRRRTGSGSAAAIPCRRLKRGRPAKIRSATMRRGHRVDRSAARRCAGPRPPRRQQFRPAAHDACDAPQAHDDRRPTRITASRPTRSATGADDEDRREAGDRHEHVEHAEDPPADVLGQVLLELRLGRDRDDRVGGAHQEGDAHDQGQHETRPGWPRHRSAATPASQEAARSGPARPGEHSRTPMATIPASMVRRRGRYRPYELRTRMPCTMPSPAAGR